MESLNFENLKLSGHFIKMEAQLFDRLKNEYMVLLDGQTYEYYQEKKDLKRQGELNQKIKQIEDFYSDPKARKEMFPLETAREIMGEDFYGPEEIKKVFDIELDESEIPKIPFSPQELEKFKAEGFMLILRVDTDANGVPLTMKRLDEIISPKLETKKEGRLLNSDDWYVRNKEKFFITETPHLGWCLQQKKLLTDTTGKNYLEQTKLILVYLKKQKFSDAEKETERQEAIQEAKKQLPAIAKLDGNNNWQEVTKQFLNLKINKYRRRAVDIVYDHALTLATKDVRLFEGKYLFDSTKSCSATGNLIGMGYGGFGGLIAHDSESSFSNVFFGVSCSI